MKKNLAIFVQADMVRFSAPLIGMWAEMQLNLRDHSIYVVRHGEDATFSGHPDDIDCFISKHYDGSGLSIEVEPIMPG